MSQKVHDHFAKQYLAYLLDSKGDVEISYEIKGTSFQVDLIFNPQFPMTHLKSLGLLGKITSPFSFLEVFWNQPTEQEVCTCLMKLHLRHHELYNQAKSKKETLAKKNLPFLWIITTSASETLIKAFRAEHSSSWNEGIYVFGEAFHTAIVAINQLPTTPETLWLRILGKDKIRQSAIEELIALPTSHPLRNEVLKLIYDYLKKIEGQYQKTNEEKEFVMELSPAYYQWEKETIQKGIQLGIHQGHSEMQRAFVENLLKLRFGELDETLGYLSDKLSQLSPEESSRLILQSSRQELLAKFGH